MDVTDLTRQVQELTARVALLTRQRDDAREGRDSLQRECEGLRLRLDALTAENGILRSATDAAVDGVRAMLPAALELTACDVLSEVVAEACGLESMLRGQGRGEAVDAVGLPLAALRRAARVTVQIDFVSLSEEPA